MAPDGQAAPPGIAGGGELGTPIAAVMSWRQYKEVADSAGIELVKSTFAGDASLLAWAPIGNAGPVLAAQE